MQWILTGGEEHWKDSNAIGNEAAVENKLTDAQKRMQGTKRVSKRKGKRSHFDTRKDRTKNEKRKTLSNAKTE